MADSKKNNKELIHIGPILKSLLSSYQDSATFSVGKLNQIVNVWTSVTGKAISDNTKPYIIKGKLLHVNVTSSVWIQQLQYIKTDLITRLNAALGGEHVDNIKFKIGKIQ
jgi:predicted nucleic acid-binding Zn ribbon protein